MWVQVPPSAPTRSAHLPTVPAIITEVARNGERRRKAGLLPEPKRRSPGIADSGVSMGARALSLRDWECGCPSSRVLSSFPERLPPRAAGLRPGDPQPPRD